VTVVPGAAPDQLHNIGGRRAWVVWAAAVSVYVVAVFDRTSLGVAGLVAAERFHITASQLATFTVVQLAVYAALQIPVGVLLDRYGSRRLLLSGLSLMTAGQFWFAFAGTFGAGVGARVLIGAGDAMVFVSVLRLVALWFHARQASLLSQVTGQLGQVGAVLAAGPLAVALERVGWTRSFVGAASVGVIVSIALLVVLKDSPYRGTPQERVRALALARSLRTTWDTPGRGSACGPTSPRSRHDRVRPPLGLPLPGRRAGAARADRQRAARPHDGDRHGHRPVPRAARGPGSLPPGAHRPRHRGVDRARLGRRAALAGAAAGQLGLDLQEASVGGASDGNFVAALGIPVLDGLGAVGAGAHARHEWISIAGMAERAALVAALVAAFADPT